MIFILLTTLEYTVIAFLERKSGGMDKLVPRIGRFRPSLTVGEFAWRADFICRYAFAAAEILFLIGYFNWYTGDIGVL